jgi:hypothetical protein
MRYKFSLLHTQSSHSSSAQDVYYHHMTYTLYSEIMLNLAIIN